MKNYGKRAIFPSGKQKLFLLRAINKMGLPWSSFADKLEVNRRSLNDWRRERYSVPLRITKKIAVLAGLKIPRYVEIKEPFWSVKKAGEIGGKLIYEKYGIIGGDPEIRKKKWLKWWRKNGRFNLNKPFMAKEITVPSKNIELAEFVGIMMGDGGISKRQIMVSLNHKVEKPYSIFVANLIKKLFLIKPSIYIRKRDSVISIVVSRTRLVSFCKSIGLKIGNKLKQNLDIPQWIKSNKSYKLACIRGLMDTDGCIFNECHRINNKEYCYPRLAFTSFSKTLCQSVLRIFREMGFSPNLRTNRNVQLESQKDITGYFKLIGTENSHHKKRIKIIFGGVPKWS